VTSVELLNARYRDDAQREALFSSGWPAFISADRLAEEYLPQVRERFAQFELVALDEDVPVATSWAVPIRWDGTREGLPAGYGDSLRGALEEEDEATTLVPETAPETACAAKQVGSAPAPSRNGCRSTLREQGRRPGAVVDGSTAPSEIARLLVAMISACKPDRP
jgi:hypothetical protein